jgi:phosphate transport system protein
MDIEAEIKQLDNLIMEMSGVVEKNLNYAIDVYLNYDLAKVYNPVDDEKVNSYERWIESDALHLMIKERLYADDLRRVTGIMSMVQDLERLGDHAKDILQFALRLRKANRSEKRIKELIDFVMKMVHDSIYSYIKRDLTLARDVIIRDDHVDSEYDALLSQLIDEDKEEEITASYTVYTALVVKYLERIADHATNVAEWVVYITSGFYKDKQII